MDVHIKHMSGETTELHVKGNFQVETLKDLIQNKSGHPAAKQRLVCNGVMMEDEGTLSDYLVENGSEIYVMQRREDSRFGYRSPEEESKFLQYLLECYGVSIAQARDLQPLSDYDIVFVLDDSGSMQTQDQKGGPTRWQELRATIKTMVEFAAYFDPNGTDIYFLNRGAVKGICEPEDPRLADCFKNGPTATTPLTERVTDIVKARPDGAKPMLMVIGTDGQKWIS